MFGLRKEQERLAYKIARAFYVYKKNIHQLCAKYKVDDRFALYCISLNESLFR
jgi:hypothetical protein